MDQDKDDYETSEPEKILLEEDELHTRFGVKTIQVCQYLELKVEKDIEQELDMAEVQGQSELYSIQGVNVLITPYSLDFEIEFEDQCKDSTLSTTKLLERELEQKTKEQSSKQLEVEQVQEYSTVVATRQELSEVLTLKLQTATNSEKLKPLVERPPVLKLKTLSENLKYAFLNTENTLSIIISSELKPEKEAELLKLLIE